jgi:hypothetical protein
MGASYSLGCGINCTDSGSCPMMRFVISYAELRLGSITENYLVGWLVSYKPQLSHLSSCWPVEMYKHVAFPRYPCQHVLFLVDASPNLEISYVKN